MSLAADEVRAARVPPTPWTHRDGSDLSRVAKVEPVDLTKFGGGGRGKAGYFFALSTHHNYVFVSVR